MKIAQIITEFKPNGPGYVVKNIVDNLPSGMESTIFYLRGPSTLEANCGIKPISFRNINVLKGFDIVHSHGIRPDVLSAYAGMFSKKSLHVSTLHNYARDELLNIYGPKVAMLATPVWMATWRRMSSLAVLTQDAKDFYSSSLPLEKLHVVHNGIGQLPHVSSLSSEDDTRLKKLGSQYHILGTNAHLIQRKGIDQVIRALVDMPDCALVIVGDGPYRQTLIELAEEMKVSERCWFAGHRNNIAAFLPHYDAYIMPSRSEGFGLALLEAMEAKLPCICSDINVFREIMGDQAAFFTLEDPDSLGSAARFALNHREELADGGYKRYLQKFTGEAMGKAYAEFYSNVMSGRK
ncbi:glycosyltransferase family 4 protein [Kushneria marisflavi]|uniref:glycosyltransferase family 4 protein n=1 Tax=Kushneria marisflavi TaxID=157779 RepID=UPI000FF3CE55|nr:glycosyltransferase family 4 protein [Kushneria marisflavi]RKD76871.1 glycosyltransferase involved in cell wall biosynthesis [Kushneria marisflavi]